MDGGVVLGEEGVVLPEHGEGANWMAEWSLAKKEREGEGAGERERERERGREGGTDRRMAM